MFLVVVSNTIRFIRIQEITEGNISIFNKTFNNTFRLFNQAGFQIQRKHVDTEFKPVENTIIDIDITMNYTTSQEYVLFNYWDRLWMVEPVGGYYGEVFKGLLG